MSKSLGELFGSDPDFTGELDSVAYVREGREPGVYVGGTLAFPACDPEASEAEMLAEVEYDAARDAVVEAARAIAAFLTIHKGGVRIHGDLDFGRRRDAVQALHDALARYDAAKARYPYGRG